MILAPELLWHEGRWQAGRAITISSDGFVEQISTSAADPDTIRLAGKAMLPGLANAHSHAFQRSFRGAAEAKGDFWSWRREMYAAANRLSPAQLWDVSRMAFLEMALSGITTVGEFHYIHHQPDGTPYEDPNHLSMIVVEAARSVGLRICLLRTAYFRSGYQKPADTGQRRFIESLDQYLLAADALRRQLAPAYPHAWMGVAPHSVRAVPLEAASEIVSWAAGHRLPIHMHAAEQPAEIQACEAEYGAAPVGLLAKEKLLGPSLTLVHGIHISAEEIRQIAAAGARVCACPSTERNLGDGIVAASNLLEAGVEIALGTDSQAQIDLIEDSRELEYHLRLARLARGLIDPAVLLRCATENGTRAVAAPANTADFFTFDLRDPSVANCPLNVFSISRPAIRDVIVGGNFIVKDGRHAHQDEIIERYLRQFANSLVTS